MTHIHRYIESLRNDLVTCAVPRGITLTSTKAALAVFFWVLALVCTLKLSAQSATGSIVGTVTDQTGAVVVNAPVTLTNVDTMQTRTAMTDAHGYYVLSLLPPANYKLIVSATSFRQFLQSGIKLNVGDALTINVALQIGQTSQEVTVTSEPSQLQSETSSLGQVIANQPIVDLPTDGRNSYSFATLAPGVLASYGFTQPAVDEYNDQFVSINGSRPNANSFLLDGGVNTEPAFNGPGLYPSVDLVQEYKVQTNNYSAEFPNTAGGIINVITKPGSNKFHGSLYEFHRSTGLNANNFFAIRAGLPRAPFLFNQFGASLGGPILRNHTFFFFSYEGLRWTQAVTTTATVPTLAERSGDFSGQSLPIYNPFTTTLEPNGQYARTQFSGNIIPSGMLNPTTTTLLNYLPLPNQPGSPLVNNFISNASSPIDKNDFSLRIDQQVSTNSKLFGRYSISDTSQDRPPVWGNTADLKIGSPVLGDDTLRQMQATIDDTTVISPKVVLELNSSFVRYHLDRAPPGLGVPETQYGFPSYFSDLSNTVQCFPSISIAGVGVAESIANIGSGLAMGSFCFVGVLRDAYQTYNEEGNVTKIAGRHTLKFGGDFGTGLVATGRFDNAGGYYGFGPDFTQGPSPYDSGTSGVGFASFLLGIGDAGGFNYTGGPDEITSYKYYGGYFQDDWKVSPRLMLNLGFRYDYDAPWFERFNRITDWNPTAASPLQVPGLTLVGGLEFPGVNGLSRYQFSPDKRSGIQPRVGFAYDLGKNTVIRGGYGIFMAPVVGGGFNGNSVPNTGFLGSSSYVNSLNGVTPLNLMSNPFPTGFTYATGSSQGLATDMGESVVAMSRTRRTAYAEQWNLNVQHTFPMHFLIEVAYAASHGVHLYGDYDANQLPDRYLDLGSQLISQVDNPFYGYISSGALSGSTVAASQLLLPYPQFTGVTLGDGSSYGASSYNALQVNATRRFTNGFGLMVSYSRSKLMDNVGATETGFPGGTYAGGGVQDWYNLGAEWALATFDTPNYLAVNGTYDVPFGRNKTWFNSNKVVNYFIGGWQLNGINYVTSGTPLQVYTASNTLYNNGGTQRANWNGKNPVPNTSVKDRLNAYFNVNDFSAPAPFTYGNSPRLLGSLRAPGWVDLDLSGVKNTRLFNDRYNLQFRAEAFNIFNHPQFGPPDTALGDGTTGIVSTQINNPRELQFALKLLF